jgi:hypothetical protein
MSELKLRPPKEKVKFRTLETEGCGTGAAPASWQKFGAPNEGESGSKLPHSKEAAATRTCPVEC